MEIRANTVAFEGKEYRCIFARDISEEKRTEELMRITQISVDRANEQIFWINSEGKFVFANEAALRELGYTWEELSGMDIHQVDATEQLESSNFAEEFAKSKSEGSVKAEKVAPPQRRHDNARGCEHHLRGVRGQGIPSRGCARRHRA